MSEVNPHTHIHVTVYLYMCLYLNLEFGKRADDCVAKTCKFTYKMFIYIHIYMFECVSMKIKRWKHIRT